MKRYLLLIMTALSLMSVKAQKAYVVYTSDGILTFYYDNLKSSRSGTKYDLNTGSDSPGWLSNMKNIKKVVFTSSFAKARPTTTYGWFYNKDTSILTDIVGLENLNTSEVTNMSWMFSGCRVLTSLDVSHFNTGKVRYMFRMFSGCNSLTNLDVANFNTKNVTNMSYMFSGCNSLTNLDVTNFDTKNVTYMSHIFQSCSSLTSLDLSHFDTSKVTDMSYMFWNCKVLASLDVSRFDTRNVTDMSSMFYGCNVLTSLDVSHFNTSNVTKMEYMFDDCSSLTSLDVSYFDTRNVTDMKYMFSGCNNLTNLDVSRFDTSKVTYMSCMFSACQSLKSLDVSHFDTSNVTNMGSMFLYCWSLTTLDVSNFNTNNVTSMEDMFYGCSSLTSLDVSHFNTGNVTNMKGMFTDCNALTSLDVSHFNTGNVTKMSWMFSGCSGLIGLDVSHFDTRNVTDMYEMFYHCSSLTYLDVSHFDTSSVISMKGMFSGCSGLTGLDLSSFNTSNVTSMENMFSGCSGLTILDLSSFDMSNVTNIGYMFGGCSGLTTIYVEDNNWNIKKVTFYGHMFKGCTKLVGGAGTRYFNSELYVHGDYAHIDGGPSNPGYLTDINALKVQEKVCDSDDLLNALLALEGNGTGTEDNHATLAPCDSGLAVDNDVDIDDDLYIDLVGKKPDGSKSDMVFSGSSINVMTGSMVRMSQFVMKSDGNGGGISNSGNLTISDCELQDGDYTVENLSGSTMTLNDNTIAGSGIIVNSGNLYVDGSCTVNGLKNNAGGCIFLTSTPMTYIRIILNEVTVESLGVPVIAGADGYILTETDANALTIDVPDGYKWYYDADMQAVCIRTSTAIEDVRNNKTRVAEGYDTSGRKVSNKYRGLRILRMNDGSVKKNVKKN